MSSQPTHFYTTLGLLCLGLPQHKKRQAALCLPGSAHLTPLPIQAAVSKFCCSPTSLSSSLISMMRLT